MHYATHIKAKQHHRLHSLAMLLLLLWLTVSLPFVYERQTGVAAMQGTDGDAEAAGPFANTAEEKAEEGANTLSEYMHEVHHALPPSTTAACVFKCHPDDLYRSFRPDLFSPPPEAAA